MGLSPAAIVGDKGSNLLQALRPSELALLLPNLDPIELSARKILYEPGDNVSYVYFPCGSTLLSYIVPLEDGKEAEIALIGREGAIGGIVSQGHLPAFARLIVQFEGLALRMECAELEKAKLRSSSLRHFFSRYADCVMAQIFQCVACNAAHTIEQRTAKWMLAAIDRTGGLEIALTQEQLSGMLGVGRSYVAHVLRSLKARGLITVGRRKLRILDEEALNAVSCRCDHAVRDHFEVVLAGVYPDGAGPVRA